MLKKNIEAGQVLSSLKQATSYTSTSLHEPVRLRMSKDEHDPDYIAPQTIPQFFRECCKQYASLPALAYESEVKREEKGNVAGTSDCNYSYITYEEYKRKVEQTALLLMHVGLEPHTSVGILAHNCPEWFYTELGAMCAGGVVAGIYMTSSPEAVLHALQTAEATVCVVDDATQLAKVRAVRSHLPRLKSIIQLHGPYEDYVRVEEGYYRWMDLMALQFEDVLRDELKRSEGNIGANECAMLIFTSGTTGMPKAVMISHDSMVVNTKLYISHMNCFEPGAEVFVSYLPLNHIVGQLFELFFSLINGGCIYFADRDALKGTLPDTLLKVRPTLLFGVPRVYEKLQQEIGQNESNCLDVTNWARATILDCYMNNMRMGKPDNILKYRSASSVIYKLKVAMGLERCKKVMYGGAPISLETKQFFLGLDLPLIPIYGLSEASGGVTHSSNYRNIHSVGEPIKGFEVCIDKPDSEGCGEICMRSRSCMMGYLNESTKTEELIDSDGWLHSGDFGYLELDGAIVITGRLKELVITAGGENIPPVRIEELVKSELPCISNAMLIGDKRKYLTMLLTLKTELNAETGAPLDTLHPDTKTWLQQMGLSYTRLSEVLKTPAGLKDIDAAYVEVKPDQCVLDAVQVGLERVNAKAISRAQRVQKFTLLPHDFSMPTGELGPTLKMRRPFITQKYAHLIEKMYN